MTGIQLFFFYSGALFITLIATLIIVSLCQLIKPLYYSIHFHVIAIRGMYKSGRKPKWRYLPWHIVKCAVSDMTCSGITISGAGYYWNLDYDRTHRPVEWRIWDDRIGGDVETNYNDEEPSTENDSV